MLDLDNIINKMREDIRMNINQGYIGGTKNGSY